MRHGTFLLGCLDSSLIIPPIYLLWDFHPVDADVREVLVYAIPHLLLEGLGAATMHRNVRHSIWPEVYEVAVAPYTALVTSMAMVMPSRGRFNVTTKGTHIEKRTSRLSQHQSPFGDSGTSIGRFCRAAR